MNRGLQIALLIIVFFICTGAGFFIGKAVLGDGSSPSQNAERVDTLKSAKPIIDAVDVGEIDPTSGKYIVTVKATVENGDNDLKYALYSDEACMKEYQTNAEGVFEVDPTEDGVYYAMVVNNESQDKSGVEKVDGCIKVQAAKQQNVPQQNVAQRNMTQQQAKSEQTNVPQQNVAQQSIPQQQAKSEQTNDDKKQEYIREVEADLHAAKEGKETSHDFLKKLASKGLKIHVNLGVSEESKPYNDYADFRHLVESGNLVIKNVTDIELDEQHKNTRIKKIFVKAELPSQI